MLKRAFVVLFVIFACAVVFAFVLHNRTTVPVSDRQQSDIITPTIDAAGSTISLSTSSNLLRVNQSIQVTVLLTTESLQAIDVVLQYDKNALRIQNIQGVHPDLTLLQQKNEDGVYSTSFAINPASTENIISGKIFTFDVVAVAPIQKTSIRFNRASTIVAREGINVLKNLVDLPIEVENK